MSPTLAPPWNVAVKGASAPQTAATALMPCSQRPLETLIVAPFVAGAMLNWAAPDAPVVALGAPWHFSILPAMPPQICSCATLTECESSLLRGGQRRCGEERTGERRGHA
jgi:hypothetical protein